MVLAMEVLSIIDQDLNPFQCKNIFIKSIKHFKKLLNFVNSHKLVY